MDEYGHYIRTPWLEIGRNSPASKLWFNVAISLFAFPLLLQIPRVLHYVGLVLLRLFLSTDI